MRDCLIVASLADKGLKRFSLICRASLYTNGNNLVRVYMKNLYAAIFLATFACLCLSHANGQSDIREIKLPAGKSADLWLGINVSGTLHYAVRTRDGKNKIKMWWVMEPLGNVKQLGLRGDSGSLDIPGALSGSVSAKLRASTTSDTVVLISEKVSVANSITFHWP